MNYRAKIETALAPLVAKLRIQLGKLPTLATLDHYQFRLHLVKPDKSNAPDGFQAKWRYVWALLLAQPFNECAGSEAELGQIDKIVEEIFGVYELGAMYESPGPGDPEKEFLARLGIGLRVREADVLAFPEQINGWALARFCPFDDSYFIPTYGLRFEEITDWITKLVGTTQKRLDTWVAEFQSIAREIKSIQADVANGSLDKNGFLDKARQTRIQERLDENGRLGDRVHLYSTDDLRIDLPPASSSFLVNKLAIQPGGVSKEYTFPHGENPLEQKTFVELPDSSFYFLAPSYSCRVVAKAFERELLAHPQLRDRYLKRRDREAERWVSRCLTRLFPANSVHVNYYLEKGGLERDLLVRHNDTVVLVECKNSRVRPFAGGGDDLVKFEEDFKNSIQFAFDQAQEVKRRILASEETTFLNENGTPDFSIRRAEIRQFFVVCVTLTPRGPLGTDLSYQLAKPPTEAFPLAVNLFDLDTICKYFDVKQFLTYLRGRERLHGRVRTGDELNLAGYFLKYGNVDFEDDTYVTDDFSAVFDRKWYKEQGIEVEEPGGPPVQTAMVRRGDKIVIDHSDGSREIIRVPARLAKSRKGKPTIQMKGNQRNAPCPCGSGRKFKHCHGSQ